jgi:DNA-binding XRE family transcriptional regulator
VTKLAEAIVNYRARERISQKEFAARAGVSLQTICNIETGQQEPSRVTVAKIMLVLKKEEEENV